MASTSRSGRPADTAEDVDGLLTAAQQEQLLSALEAALDGDFSVRMRLRRADLAGQIGRTFDELMKRNAALTRELDRVSRRVGRDGRMDDRATLPGAEGQWAEQVDHLNVLIDHLVQPIGEVGRVLSAVAAGDLSRRMDLELDGNRLKGEFLRIGQRVNTMVDQLSAFSDEVIRVAREVGTEGKLGGQASVPGVAGSWRDLTDNVNSMARNLTDQVRNIAAVTTAVANGDLSQKITVEAEGEILELKDTINTMVDQLSSFADEVTRVAREVGTEGELGGQAAVPGVSGTWKDLTDNVNSMARNLTDQVRNISAVATAVANGDLSQKITVGAEGEILGLKTTLNRMVDQLSSFADEVTRVAREVGTEGKLGGQAVVPGVSGTWKGLTDNVNSMAHNLTGQVRNIATVTTAVANGDLSQKITVEAEGEILELKDTINTMVDQLSSFADEVTRVAREVGTEGKLGGQAAVPGVSGTWKDLTDNVNQLAANLTTQVRAIAEVSRAVTRGDLTQQITVDASGEVAGLKDTINQMIANLRETTETNAAQDWLKTNIARVSTMLQGQRDISTVADLIMSHVTPLIDAQVGAFFVPAPLDEGEGDAAVETELRLVASYAYADRHTLSNRFRLGEGLVGQAALERSPIVVTEAPPGYVITSGLGEAAPVAVLVVPITFEDELMGVLEFASFAPFTETYRQLLTDLVETLGVVLNTIDATMRTEELLVESQRLTQELQAQSEELQAQQEELQQTNEELEEKAELLETQKRAIEEQNQAIESARQEVELRAEQLALSSKYKSEFLANMSHELRTPLNSMLILSRLLADEGETLSEEQREFAETIHRAGNDLLDLINDILDLSKIEAGRMDVAPTTIAVDDLVEPVRASLAQLAADRDLDFEVALDEAPPHLFTDPRRLQQILKNLLSNAIKFTDEGSVLLRVTGDVDRSGLPHHLHATDVVAFHVVDTGVGIDEQLRHVIFEAFQQGDGTTSRKHSGTGLGLSISRELAALLGGTIELDSSPGEGSTFSLYLPVSYVPVEDDEQPPPLAPIAPPAAVEERSTERPSGDGDGAGSASEPAVGQPVADDRDDLRPGEPCLVAFVPDADAGERVLRLGHRAGHKVVVALDRTAGFALAAGFRPSGVLLHCGPPDDTLSTLTYLKRRRETRQVPVCVAIADDEVHAALRVGAAVTIPTAPDDDELADGIGQVMALGLDESRCVLVVEDDAASRRATAELLGRAQGVEVTTAGSAEEAAEVLAERAIDLVVLDLSLPARTGLELLEQLRGDEELATLPVIIHTAKDLTRKEETQLRRLAESVVVKTVGSPARLLDEALLHLHRSPAALPADQQQLLEELYSADETLRDKRLLIVDDDARNVLALTKVLEGQGMLVDDAENGREALERISASDRPYDVVLMDIMMPEMDGHEATRRIRELPDYADRPIITLSAKAMREDRTESLAAGASDFITKPVDLQQLLSLLRVWLYR
jgi:signal transduction histidine kinase/CheY-like chemotaxis protein/HAMP domain-containing protein